MSCVFDFIHFYFGSWQMMNHLVTIMATLIQITALVREEVPKLSSRVGCYTVLTAILIVYSNSMEDVV